MRYAIRGTCRPTVAVLVALSLLGALLVAAPAAAAGLTATVACNDPQKHGRTDPTAKQSGGARPVVLVHGWTGKPMTDTATALTKTLGGAISTFTFDYGNYATYWASSDHIAPCLANYIRAVSTAYTAKGGDGRVIVVAHSMGGLATRYAFTPKYAGTADDAAKDPFNLGGTGALSATQVAAVVTLSTPYKGSPLGHTFAAAGKELISKITGDALPGLASGDGADCLAPHSGTQPLSDERCGDVPGYLPAGIDVTAIGGEITVDRQLFGHTMYSIPTASDGIVPVSSAHDYATGGPAAAVPGGLAHLASNTDSCRVTTDALSNVLNTVALPAQLAVDHVVQNEVQSDTWSTGTQIFLLAASVAAPCSHQHISTDQSAINQTTEAIRATLATLAPKPVDTVVTALRPVTADGQPGPGWTVDPGSTTPDPSNPLDCGGDPTYGSTPYSSESAVDPDIYDCAPTAASAHNCWTVANQPQTMLCVLNLLDQTLQYQSYAGTVGAVTPPTDPSPAVLELDNGEKCTIRLGGAGDTQQDHPDWFADYYCDSGAVWAPDFPGINRSTTPWTVQVGPADGHLSKRAVTKALTIGTAS